MSPITIKELKVENYLSEKTEYDIYYLSSKINSVMNARLYLKKLQNRKQEASA